MTFTFDAICNKLSKLKLLQEFRSLHISIFVTTNQGTELYSLDIKDEVSNFITDCVDLVLGRLSMIFTVAAICNKLSKHKLM